MTDISQTAADARETARSTTTGQFGHQQRTAPELALTPDDGRAGATAVFEKILADYPEAAAHAREFIAPQIGNFWAPHLAYVEYDDKLDPEHLDAYLRGDDEPLDGVDIRFREGDSYEDAIEDYLRSLTGTDPTDFYEDTLDELRQYTADLDTSTVIPHLVRHGGDVLVQLPVVDDETFGRALEEASQVEDEEERYAAIEKAFHDALAGTGIELDQGNRGQIRELIDETSLDFGFQSSEQWKLRLVTCTDPEEVAMSSHGEHGDAPRELTLEHPTLLLIDPWNGRSHDVRVSGHLTTTVTPERPARLDAVLGYGSLGNIAGDVHAYYRHPVKVRATE